jgi:lipopolysaccharide transport system ATP-binding protein
MYVRLAFAVAAHLEPEILIVDEVLAVGDAAFQRRCLGKMKDVAGKGRTVLFVSHNMAAITRLCPRALWFEDGRLQAIGDSDGIVPRYLASGTEDNGELLYDSRDAASPGSDFVKLEAIRTRSHDGCIASTLDVRHPIGVEVQYRVLRPTTDLRIGIRVLTHDGGVLLSTTDMDDRDERIREPGVYLSRCELPSEFLNYGQYYVSVGCDFPMRQVHFTVDQGLCFRIAQTGGAGGHINDGRAGMLRPRLPWSVKRIE